LSVGKKCQRAKKLPCGHILHLHCLRSWLERQQICPICISPLLQEEIPQRQNVQIPANWNPQFMNQQGWNMPQFRDNLQNAPHLGDNAQNIQQFGNNVPNLENQFQAQPVQRPPTGGEQQGANQIQIDLLRQVEFLQQQLLFMNQQLQLVQAYLTLQVGQNVPVSQQQQQAQSQSQQTVLNEDEEMLKRALAESVLSQPSTGISSTSVTTPQEPDPVLIEDKTETEEEKSTSDEIRRRRLLRFSQNN